MRQACFLRLHYVSRSVRMTIRVSPDERFLSHGRQGSYSGHITDSHVPVRRWFFFAGLSLGGTVPLSDHEQRMLDQIERALYAEDPKFASAVRSTDPQVHYKRRIWKAVIGFVLGLFVVLAGVIVNTMPISIVIS